MKIGQKIRERAEELGIGPTTLGRMINTSKQNVYGIYERDSISTELLEKLCKVLDYDFFSYFYKPGRMITGEPVTTYSKNKKAQKNLEQENKMLRHELEELREKYELLRELYFAKTGKKPPGKI